MNLKDARLFFRAVLLWIAFAIGFSGYVHAQDQEWWFDVEVIVFSRLLDAPPDETFETGIEKTISWYLDNESWLNDVTSGNYQKYYDSMYQNR